MYTKPDGPIHGAQRKKIIEQLTQKGFGDAHRLPETLTLKGIYQHYKCEDDGNPCAQSIYGIVNKIMNE